uniref:Secreted protein n=1 Tax=Bursaphelenchus xylophilus TaxID=6326 RepID=A0A1I7SRJ7_BURXY
MCLHIFVKVIVELIVIGLIGVVIRLLIGVIRLVFNVKFVVRIKFGFRIGVIVGFVGQIVKANDLRGGRLKVFFRSSTPAY